ncbi:MAG: carbon-nitrogen hydrolase family protein [Bryobacteraceae bacterium]
MFSTRRFPRKPERRVRIASIGFNPPLALEKIAELVDGEGRRGTDLIVLPELSRGQDQTSMEGLDGPTVTAMARLAKRHQTYIVCAIDCMEGGVRRNSAVLLDRQGNIASVYDKMYPLFPSEFDQEPPVCAGSEPSVCETDFGRVGLSICFDVNWPDVWGGLAARGAELVAWPSGYSGGRMLQSHAIQNHFYIVSATWIPDGRVYDIDGAPLAHERDRGGGVSLMRATVDLDRCIFHRDGNYPAKLERLLLECGQDIEMERFLEAESWFILRSRREGVSAREIARQYGLEELGPYIRRCELDIEARRRMKSRAALP